MSTGLPVSEKELRQSINNQIEEEICERLRTVVEDMVATVLSDLEDGDFDTETKLEITERVIYSTFANGTLGEKSGERSNTSEGRTVEIPVAGRTNESGEPITTETVLEEHETPTKTKEVPIEGGDVEDPDTMEIEVPDPDAMTADITQEHHEWVRENSTERLNDDTEDDEEYNPADIPEGGLPFYQ